MQRIDIYPTHRHGDYLLRAGRPIPFGASMVPGGINFAVFSRYATSCTLILFKKGSNTPLVEIPFPDPFHIGNVYAMVVFDLDYENIEYGYRMDGPYQPHLGHHFDTATVLLDPYARLISGREKWGEAPDSDNRFQHRAMVVQDDFDWIADRPLETPLEDLIIYEMHVRGLTRHPSSGVKYPGTFAGVREKIPYLKELGINCVELMPIHEFDEFDNKFKNPDTGERLLNYWGYSTIGFFAPKAGYAATGQLGMQVDELKALVKELHRNGIEVILDVVFNHTGEGEENDATISFRGLDNKTYYMLQPDGRYQNFSGCGNTMNCNNPVVRNMVLDSLRYWAAEYHIDGFRFDLASIMGRDAFGQPLANPPLLEALAYDPILGKCKLIAEAWDAGGLYQVGSFPAYERWSEWNDQYRDTLRRFLKGDMGQVRDIALLIQGAPNMYADRGPTASINFITAHDGFTLADLFSYNEKHNRANGEENRDGHSHNYSWNCGHEGASDDLEIQTLRRQLMKNGIAILLVSQGVPMILMGDEVAHTKQGNNNTYCQDNELSWFDWSQLESEADMFTFVKHCISFRKQHRVLRNRFYFQQRDAINSGYPDISWHGAKAWKPDWSDNSRTLSFMLCGEHVPAGKEPDNYIYVAMNMHWENHTFQLPRLPKERQWHLFMDTSLPSGNEICEPGQERLLSDQNQVLSGARSVIILVGR
ncbi:MAG: glycogen debranching protein GlgX [Chloroflexi bacterium]|jgi:glycogen operon protein|nr:glycogen debranching protein GlgX [Chloroflexota bacterium]